MRRAARNFFLGLALSAAAVNALPAVAQPLLVSDAAGIARLAHLMESYEGVARVRWVIAGGDSDARADLLDHLESELGTEKSDLMERVRTDSSPVSRALATTATASTDTPRAYIEIADAVAGCSWSVAVTDPLAPSPGADAIAIPLEPGDKIPASPAATYQVGFSGPLQSTLYALAETTPGSIRDLAAAPQIAIPVADQEETLVLVRARQPVPFFDALQTRLAATPGERQDLGPDANLAARFTGNGRGIGALIQLVDPAMVVADAGPTIDQPPTPKSPDEVPVAKLDDLTETCLFMIEPAVQM